MATKSQQLITKMILLSVFIQIEGQTAFSSCGRLGSNNVIPFLTNSFRTNFWPWHAAIYHRLDESDPFYVCGGTVISKNSILSAGHCVSIDNELLDAKQVFVKLGRLNLAVDESSGQSFMVTEIIIHPNYSSIDFANDIAIIRISPDATFNVYVQPICLWKADNIDISKILGKLGKVVGWGKTETGRVSNVLQIAYLPVVGWGQCLKSNPHNFGQYLSETNFCAGNRNGTSVCTGDSGGSMTFEEAGIHYIRGIVSVGASRPNPITQQIECDSMQYAIFTDVAHYLQWIRENALERGNNDDENRRGVISQTEVLIQTDDPGRITPQQTPVRASPCPNGGKCVPYYECAEGQLFADGEGLLDIIPNKNDNNPCNNVLEVCCNKLALDVGTS